jgi:hypothetical protein
MNRRERRTGEIEKGERGRGGERGTDTSLCICFVSVRRLTENNSTVSNLLAEN